MLTIHWLYRPISIYRAHSPNINLTVYCNTSWWYSSLLAKFIKDFTPFSFTLRCWNGYIQTTSDDHPPRYQVCSQSPSAPKTHYQEDDVDIIENDLRYLLFWFNPLKDDASPLKTLPIQLPDSMASDLNYELSKNKKPSLGKGFILPHVLTDNM